VSHGMLAVRDLYDSFFDPAARGIGGLSVLEHRRRVVAYTAWVIFDVVNDDGTRRVDKLRSAVSRHAYGIGDVVYSRC